jgi:hypothetical protein
MVARQVPAVSVRNGDDKVVVRTHDGAHGGKGEHILMREFESASACGESAPVKCGVS